MLAFLLLCGFLSSLSYAQEKLAKRITTDKPMMIESQVKGSQEQPNVIYIMPWQSIDHTIPEYALPKAHTELQFKPVNPKEFRRKVNAFALKQKHAAMQNKEQ